MGFFSWKTSDTEETIYNAHTDECRTVYFLQPGGVLPIKDDAYEGYGVFSTVDVYEWLFRMNKEELLKRRVSQEEIDRLDNDVAELKGERRDMALRYLSDLAYLYKDTQSGDFLYEQIIKSFNQPLPEYDNLTASDLLESGRWIKEMLPNPPFPLKFSFDENAVYENLEAAELCESQGYFYERGAENEPQGYLCEDEYALEAQGCSFEGDDE